MPGIRSRFLREARAARKSVIRMSRVSVITASKTVSVSSHGVGRRRNARSQSAARRPLPLALALEVIEQAARALAAAERAVWYTGTSNHQHRRVRSERRVDC